MGFKTTTKITKLSIKFNIIFIILQNLLENIIILIIFRKLHLVFSTWQQKKYYII